MTSHWLAVLGCWVVLLALEPVTLLAAGDALKLTSAKVRVGIRSSTFVNVNRNDAEASLKTFVSTLAKRRGYRVEIEIEYFEDSVAFVAAMTNRMIHLATVDSWEYVDMNLARFMEPSFVLTQSGKTWQRYLLLTRTDSGLKSLADLRGKSVGIIRASNAKMAMPWIESKLMECQFGKPDRFFGNIEMVDKPTLTVLPVFFGKKQACVVNQDGFEVMKELNPNVGRQLVPMLASDELTENIVLLNAHDWTPPQLKNDVMEAIEELHQDPAGQQLLHMFKCDKAIPFQAQQLDTMRKLRAATARWHTQSNP